MNKTLVTTTLVVAALCGASLASADTWTGKISDSSCGASHDTMTEHGKKGSDKDCTLICVKDGSKFVFVSKDTVMPIANQDFKDLKAFAGETVTLTGDLKDKSITVTKIEKAK
jgi:hypothetical protein